MRRKIAGGRIFDPASGRRGETGDLYLDGERLVPPLEEVDEVLEAHGQAVLAAGVELRAPLWGFGGHLLHLRGEALPPEQVGELYARLGYTHVHAGGVTVATAAAMHRHLAALRVVDASASLEVNLRDLDLALKDPARLPEVAQTLCLLQARTRTLGLSVAEPFVRYRQDYYAHRTLPGPQALEVLAALAAGLGCRLFLEAFLELLSWPLPEPERFHLGGLSRALVGEAEAEAAARLLGEGATGDLGLCLPGPASLPVWVEVGGFAPRCLNARPGPEEVKRARKLALDFPCRGLAFSTLGPLSRLEEDFPRLLTWLGGPDHRPPVRNAAPDPRGWTLFDWAYATRFLPAELLGLRDRGRLTPGARADIALYDLPPDGRLDGLARCRTLIKAGRVVIRDFVLVAPEVPRQILFRQAEAAETRLFRELSRAFSFRPETLWSLERLGGPWAEV
jgi:formylmethanofuran dehydrogenase subunit A